MVAFEPRCKVCTSPNRKTYEENYLTSDPKPAWQDLEEQAKILGEEISYKAFERHFTRHYSAGVAELVEKEGQVTEVVKEARQEVINIVEEIKDNLNGLKTLLQVSLDAYKGKPISPQMLRGLTDLYREHRQSIESCERLTGKLTEGTTMSEAEILKLLYTFAKDFCPICTSKFKTNLDEYLRSKGHDSVKQS